MAILTPILTCLGLLKPRSHLATPASTAILSEKQQQQYEPYHDNPSTTTATAQLFVHELLTSPVPLLKPEFTTTSWTETLAASILEHLEAALEAGANLSSAAQEALEKSTLAAEALGFVREHPVYATIIAIGVLVALAPWVLEVLGFAEAGIVADSWAALWQSRFMGFVPKGSLFSFLQRLGMTWAH